MAGLMVEISVDSSVDLKAYLKASQTAAQKVVSTAGKLAAWTVDTMVAL